MPKRLFPQNETNSTALDVVPKRRKLPFGKLSVAPVTTASTGSNQKNNDELGIRKLDPLIPQEEQRMKTRYKMVQKGKNTVGYDEYLKKVPFRLRRKSKEHPVTPDHILDIPNRRWQGQVKAWRISLHQYDPKDLASDIHMEPAIKGGSEKVAGTIPAVEVQGKSVHSTIQESQIALASSEGLQVDFSANIEACDVNNMGFVDCTNQDSNEINEWENAENDLADFEDSDDDLL